MITKYFVQKNQDEAKQFTCPLRQVEKLLSDLRPVCPEWKDWEWKDCESFCQNYEVCCSYDRLQEIFTEPLIVCMCSDQDGTHQDNCYLGEKGKKIRRRLEDRLRKDPLLMRWVARLIGLSD